MNLSNVQQRAVDELFSYFVDSYNHNNKINKIIDFKAPTGSGKTFMISNFIDKASIYHHDLIQDQKIIFVIATLSSAKLPIQMENNINEYLSYLENKDLKVKRYESPSSSSDKLKDGDYRIIANNNEIIIFGTQSFGKRKIYTEQGIFDAFLDQIKKENYKLVYIRDEAHIGSDKEAKDSLKFLDYYETNAKTNDVSVKFEQKIQEAASFIVKMTATPKGKHKQVIITEKDLENDNIHLLKTKMFQNHGLDALESSNIDNIKLLEIAIKQFKKLKDRYIDFKNEPGLVNINPAVLIQVSDKFKGNEKEFEENINLIIKTLKDNGLTYAKYFSSEKIDSDQRAIKSLQDISRNSSDIDAIIFKVGPATGWNIPRACMLIQLRNVSSNTLSIQTIGRIKRNPNPNYPFSDESIANQYFIYTNNDIKDSEIVTYRLRDQYMDNHIKFGSGKINLEIHKKISKSEKYKENILALFNKKKVEYYLKNALDDYNKNGYLDGLVIKYKDGNNIERNCVYQKIYNILELQKLNNKFQVQNSNVLTKDIIKNINSWFYKQNFQKSIHLFWYVIKNNYFDLILKEYKQELEIIKIKTRDKEYLLEFSNTLPEIFSINTKGKKNICISDEHYAYQNIIINNDEINTNKHYTDSETENKFISRLITSIEDDDNLDNNIKIWTKNPVHDGISYQYYFEKNNSIFNSYPDILIVIEKNNKKHQLVVEVKNDIDLIPEKTESLLKAYKKYIEEFSIPLFKEIESLTIAICRVKNNKLTFKGYSSNKEINKLLSCEIDNLKWIKEIVK